MKTHTLKTGCSPQTKNGHYVSTSSVKEESRQQHKFWAPELLHSQYHSHRSPARYLSHCAGTQHINVRLFVRSFVRSSTKQKIRPPSFLVFLVLSSSTISPPLFPLLCRRVPCLRRAHSAPVHHSVHRHHRQHEAHHPEDSGDRARLQPRALGDDWRQQRRDRRGQEDADQETHGASPKHAGAFFA